MTANIRDAIRTSAAPFDSLPQPEAVDEKTLKLADLAVQGIMSPTPKRDHELEIGRTNIDWGSVDNAIARFGFIGQLMRAYEATGNADYADAAVDYIRDYTRIPRDAAIGNTLDVGGRSQNICSALNRLVDIPELDDSFFDRAVESTLHEMEWLRAHMANGINWRIFNSRALLFMGLYLSFRPETEAWRKEAVAILNDAWHRQILPDSFHFEANPGYHLGMARTFYSIYRIGKAVPELGLNIPLEGLEKMYDIGAAVTRPNGTFCAIHDCQGYNTGHSSDPEQKARASGHRTVNGIRERADFRKAEGLSDTMPPTSQFFPNAGLGFFRTGWTQDDQYATFDATHWGSGHCHLSQNAVTLHAFRRSMVIDTGWLSYSASKWGCLGKSTVGHTTCNLNGLNQSQTFPTRTDYHHLPGYDCCHNVYEGGYWDSNLAWNFSHAKDGIWASHARTMLWVHNRFMFVADSMARLPHDENDTHKPSFECNWQLSEDATLTIADDASRVKAQWREGTLLLLFPIRPPATELTVYEGSEDPLRGWLPGDSEPNYVPAPQLCLKTPAMQKRHDYFVSVLIPSQGDTAPDVTVEAVSPNAQIGHLALTWEDGSADEIHWGCGFHMMLGQQDDFNTDSSLVHIHKTPNERIDGGCCMHGTYMEPFTSEVFDTPRSFLIGSQ